MKTVSKNTKKKKEKKIASEILEEVSISSSVDIATY